MRNWITGVSLIAFVVSAPALAAPQTHHAAPKVSSATDVKVDKQNMPDFGAMFALMDKMFPAQPDPDPARLALARNTVNAMWPDGTYGKMMNGLIGGMITRAMQLKQSDFESLSPKAAKVSAVASDKDESLHDTLARKDPYFDQRIAAIGQVIDEESGKVSAIVDPRMREGLSRAMARRLDEHQLADVNAFFATPSGHAFAAQYTQLWVDPEAIRSIFNSMPDMMKLMPDMMLKVQAANDKFPKPPKGTSAPAKK